MDRTTIGSWVRQSRHRAKKYNIYNDLTVVDVEEIVTTQNKCVYCDGDAEVLDHPFPLKDKVPNTPANVTSICKECKKIKKTNDLVWMFQNGYIKQEQYILLLEMLFSRRGGDQVKQYVRRVTGLVE